MSKQKNKRIGRGFGFCLILITVILVGVPLGAFTYFTNQFISEDILLTAENNNYTISTKTAAAAEKEFNTVCSNSLFFLDILNANTSQLFTRKAVESFFDRNPNIGAIAVSNGKQYINEEYFSANALDQELFNDFITFYDSEIQEATMGLTSIINVAPLFKVPLVAILAPWKTGGKNQAMILLYSTEELTQLFAAGDYNQSYMINHRGDLIIHSDYSLIEAGANIAKLSLVENMKKSKESTGSVTFMDSDKEYLGAYTMLTFANAGVLSQIEKETVMKTIELQTQQNFNLSLAALSLAVLIMFIISLIVRRLIKKAETKGEKLGKGENMGPNS